MRPTTLLICALVSLGSLSGIAATFAFASTVVDCDEGSCPRHWATLYSTLLFAVTAAIGAVLIRRLR